MHFKPEKIQEFEAMFDRIKEQIRNQPGCELLELYQDLSKPEEFFTYSYWQTENDLNNYRESALFREIWPTTKAMFNAPPTAHSVVKKHSLS
jgi:heme-degrading monooxygenase HmoA